MALSPPPSPLHVLPSSSTRLHAPPFALASHFSSSFSPTFASHDDFSIPKSQPFNRSRITRSMREPSLLEKAERAISDRCMIMEGDAAYRCWQALFEFEDLKDQYTVQCDAAEIGQRSTACRPLERFESMVRQSNGVASLIENVRMFAKTSKMRKAAEDKVAKIETPHELENQRRLSFSEPGALPPTQEELELERSAMMPESPFTRLLRTMGGSSSWSNHHFGTA